MAAVALGQDQNLEYHLITLFEKLESIRRDNDSNTVAPRPSMQAEVRTLEFWRSIISECLASFFYVFIVCGAAAGAGGSSLSANVIVATALATGFAMATLTQCFAHISGAHVNPSVTVAMFATRSISAIRAVMFITAQCGGGIAGAALLYGITVPDYSGSLGATVAQLPPHLSAWERFGIEFILTFIVVFTYFVSMDSYRKLLSSSALSIGSAYLACTLVSMPSLNPARSLGPAFVMNKWDNHWVYWIGPLLGGAVSGIIYEFIFNPRRHVHHTKESIDGDSSSIHSDEDTYDELDKPVTQKFHGSAYNTYRTGHPQGASGPVTSPAAYCPSLASASLYSTPPCKLDRVESLYGGTKSLYAKSPPLTRANLNRSQSVYSKVPSNHREALPRAGPLVPAQSLYPMRFNQNSTTTTNQNVQNQNQSNIYGGRAAREIYGGASRDGGNAASFGKERGEGGATFKERERRPESMYGVTQRRQDSADSSYGSYQSNGSGVRGQNGNYEAAKKNYVGTVASFEVNAAKAGAYPENVGFEGGAKLVAYEGTKKNFIGSGPNFDGNLGGFDQNGGKVVNYESNPPPTGNFEGNKNFVASGGNFDGNKKGFLSAGGNFEGNGNGKILSGFEANPPVKGNFEVVMKNYQGNPSTISNGNYEHSATMPTYGSKIPSNGSYPPSSAKSANYGTSANPGGNFPAGSNQPPNYPANAATGNYGGSSGSGNYGSTSGSSSGNYASSSGSSTHGNYASKNALPPSFNAAASGARTEQRAHAQQSNATPTLVINTANAVTSYHHNSRHSPNPQY